MDVIGDPRKIAARIPQTAENEVFGEYLGKYLAYKDAILQSSGKRAYTQFGFILMHLNII